MIGGSLKLKRKRLLPEIKDFSDPQDRFRYSNNVKAMSFNDWFWLHPSSYKLIYYGINAVMIVSFGSMAIIFAILRVYILSVIFAIITAPNVLQLRKKLKERKFTKYTTMYDMYLRDY